MIRASCQLNPINLSESTALNSMVENRRVFNLKNCELNIFETYHPCNNVILSHKGLVISSMMRGRKIMSFLGGEDFEFLPGESIILPEGVSMKVDFPDADEKHPVQCATLSLEWDMVLRNLDFLNEQYPNTCYGGNWKLNFDHYHFNNNSELAASINRLISISMEDSPEKDALADLSLKFLLLRVIQTQQLYRLENRSLPDGRLTPAIQYIRNNLQKRISVDDLARKTYMSRSVFYQAFRGSFGLTPLEYIQRERIAHAKAMMADQRLSITEICYESGFNNLNYFIRLFKRFEGITPSVYKKS